MKSLSVALLLALSFPIAAQQQQATSHDHEDFPCAVDGLKTNKSAGCLLLAQPIVSDVPAGPLYWHLTTFRTRRSAEAAKRNGDAVVAADGRFWLSSLGARNDTSLGGTHVAAIGPLPMPAPSTYRVELYYVMMPPHQHTMVHTHPGPEAWYILEGEQCLQTPGGASRGTVGQSLVGPAGGTPMRLTNTGTTARRALFIVVHDSAKAWTSPSAWKPSGSCEPAR